MNSRYPAAGATVVGAVLVGALAFAPAATSTHWPSVEHWAAAAPVDAEASVRIPDGHPSPPTPVDGGDAAGRALLTAAFAGPTRAVIGTVVVVVMDPDGPFVSELDVRATPTGEMVVGRSDAFSVGRDGDDAFLARDGTLLRLGTPEEDDGALDLLFANYDVQHAGRAVLDTGAADVIDLFDDQERRRERLFIDEFTGVVARRETYGPRGNPRRLVAYTELTAVEPHPDVRTGASSVMADGGPIQALSSDSLETLGRTGWVVPPSLPGGYRLSRGYALGNGPEESSLHLVYTDGLYSTSIYQQRGGLASSAVEGAVPTLYRSFHLWRWPGAQPERMAWSAEGMTFTAVGDATVEQVLQSLQELPNSPPDDLRTRIRRGIHRVGSWLNPLA